MMMRFMIALLAISLPVQVYANADGRTRGGITCGGCHGTASTAVTTTLTGPATLVAGTSAMYTVSITQVAGSVGAGLNVAIDPSSLAGATLGVVDANTQLFAVQTGSLVPQLTHVNALASAPAGNVGDWSYSFMVNAPLAAGSILLNAVMNAFDGDGDTGGDLWDATTFAISVVLPEPSTALLLGMGAAGLIGFQLRRRGRAR
jgi:PEP-CTERM motif